MTVPARKFSTPASIRNAFVASGVALSAALSLAVTSPATGNPASASKQNRAIVRADPVGEDASSVGVPGSTDPSAAGSAVVPGDRDRLLGRGWKGSADLAVTSVGDSRGFHVLVAEARTGYAWRTAATLFEPGMESDQWVGNVCLTGSGRRAVVVYEPRHFTNRAHLFDRGAFAAVVDVVTGEVTKLDVNVSIAYHNPGCGAGELVVLSQGGASDRGRTRLHVVDTVRGAITARRELPGQVTSAVPDRDGIVAVRGGHVIRVDASGKAREVAAVRGVAAYLRPDAKGGVAFLERADETTAVVKYLRGPRVVEVARGRQGEVGLASGADGRIFLTGKAKLSRSLPATMSQPGVPAGAEVSTLGRLAVEQIGPPPIATEGDSEASVLRMRATVAATGKNVEFRVRPGMRSARFSGQGGRLSPTLKPAWTSPAGDAGTAAVGSPTDPVDADRSCAVPRNDVRTQVEQPHWEQVEWAADLAVRGELTVTRPDNWRQSGLPAWSPQGMERPLALHGGGQVPAVVLLGILAQESNLWQASWHAVEGVPGNPLVGDYYGRREGWVIDWANADCGYGVAQVTDGMRLSSTTRSADEKRAIAVDYATNIAAGLRILQDKWNQVHSMGITVNNDDSSRPENWFTAVWAYNSGINPQAITGNTSGCTPGPTCTDDRGNWGLGWSNNPANPDYPFDRQPFLTDPSDAAHPGDWPYPEKVMGWAAYPIVKYDFRDDSWYSGYAQAWWVGDAERRGVKPPIGAFCSPKVNHNNCSIDTTGDGACGYWDYHCWWHEPVTWKSNCDTSCGHDNATYQPGDPEPARGTHYPPVCSRQGLPADALIVDDVPDSVGVVRADRCAVPLPNLGTFTWQFAGDPNGLFPSKKDTHQVGGGINGHFWFSHEYDTPTQDAYKVKATGTWTLGQSINGWARVFVHMPEYGADTQQAHYVVDRGASATPAATRYKTRVLPQRHGANRWVPLGVFNFAGTPEVSLSNIVRTSSGLGVENVAWDAVAFQRLPAKPKNFVVALGDSYSSGEGAADNAAEDYYYDSNQDGDGDERYRNDCHRSKQAWSRKALLGDNLATTIGARTDSFDPTLDYHLIACSGAETENLLPSYNNPISGQYLTDPTTGLGYKNAWGESATGQLREVSQLDKGFLDENTTLVTLSIGGNDSKFGEVAEACIFGIYCMNNELDGRPIKEYVPSLINNEMRTSATAVLRAIHQLAPNAKIVLMGYPELFADNADCFPLGLISNAEAAWMNDQAAVLANSLKTVAADSTAAGIPVRFVDPRPEFHGQEACGSPESIHAVVHGLTAGEDPDRPLGISRQSMHPKELGTTNYAKALNRELRAWENSGRYGTDFVDGGDALTDDWGDHYTELGQALCDGCASNDTDLVMMWESILYAEGLLSKGYINSWYSAATADATRQWQARYGITVNGRVDNQTWTRADGNLKWNADNWVYYDATGAGEVILQRGDQRLYHDGGAYDLLNASNGTEKMCFYNPHSLVKFNAKETTVLPDCYYEQPS